jgi:hypothetical protein
MFHCSMFEIFQLFESYVAVSTLMLQVASFLYGYCLCFIYMLQVYVRCFNCCIRMLHSCVSYCTSFMLFGESRARGVMVAWRGHRECPRVLTSGPLLLWRKKARFLMAWPRYTCLFRKDDIPCCYLHWVAVYTKLPNEKNPLSSTLF